MWEVGKLSKLLQEAQKCDKQLSASLTLMTPEQLERMLNRLMLEMTLLTEHGVGGVLDPEAQAHSKTGPLGKSVDEVLKAKHPVRRSPHPSAFLQCELLPHLAS